MVELVVAAIYLVLAIIQWVIASAVYNAFTQESSKKLRMSFDACPTFAIGAITLASFIPFPGGFIAHLIIWLFVAFSERISVRGRVVYFLLLGAMVFITRLAAFGAASY